MFTRAFKSAGAGRGSRTPKGRSPADFESAASASSAIPAECTNCREDQLNLQFLPLQPRPISAQLQPDYSCSRLFLACLELVHCRCDVVLVDDRTSNGTGATNDSLPVFALRKITA